MSYYIKPWGSSATFNLQDKDGRTLQQLNGKVKTSGPLTLKHPSSEFPPGYPKYEVITVSGTTEVVEHRKQEPKFYVSDDPAVWKELGANPN